MLFEKYLLNKISNSAQDQTGLIKAANLQKIAEPSFGPPLYVDPQDPKLYKMPPETAEVLKRVPNVGAYTVSHTGESKPSANQQRLGKSTHADITEYSDSEDAKYQAQAPYAPSPSAVRRIQNVNRNIQRVGKPLEYAFLEGADRVFGTLSLPGKLLYSGINALAARTVIPTSPDTPATPHKKLVFDEMARVYSPETASNIATVIGSGYDGAEAALAAKGFWNMSKLAFPKAHALAQRLVRQSVDGTRSAIRRTPQYTKFAQKAPEAVGKPVAKLVGDKDYPFFKYLYGDRFYPQFLEKFNTNGAPAYLYEMPIRRQAIAQWVPEKVVKHRIGFAPGVKAELRTELANMRGAPKTGLFVSNTGSTPAISKIPFGIESAIGGFSSPSPKALAEKSLLRPDIPEPIAGSKFMLRYPGGMLTPKDITRPFIVAGSNPTAPYHELAGHDFSDRILGYVPWGNTSTKGLSYHSSAPIEVLGARRQILKAFNHAHPNKPLPTSSFEELAHAGNTLEKLSPHNVFTDKLGNPLHDYQTILSNMSKLKAAMAPRGVHDFAINHLTSDDMYKHALKRWWKRHPGRSSWGGFDDLDLDYAEDAVDKFKRWRIRHVMNNPGLERNGLEVLPELRQQLQDNENFIDAFKRLYMRGDRQVQRYMH